MFSATEPLASSPVSVVGTSKLVYAAGTLRNAAETLSGTAARRKMHYASAGLLNPAQTVRGTSQRIRVLFASSAVRNAPQRVAGTALYTRIVRAAGGVLNAPQTVAAICYTTVTIYASSDLLQAIQLVSGGGTVEKDINGTAALANAHQTLIGAGTRIRVLTGYGDLTSGIQEIYGSEFTPIWIKTLAAPINTYEVALVDTYEPYSTTNHFLTIYQVPGYKELQQDGSYIERSVTAVITAMSACTSEGTPQPIAIIVVKVEGVKTYYVMPSYDVHTGQLNVLPMRDFNLVTGDVIQVKALGTGDVNVSLSMLLNTQPYYEVI